MTINVNIVPRAGTFSRSPSPHRVVALVYEGLCTFEFGIVVEMFGLPRPEMNPWYEFSVCGLKKRPVRAIGGITVAPAHGLQGLEHADTIIIPGWPKPIAPPSAELVRALVRAHDRGARLVSLCVGSFVLAETGLLNGRRATTHWSFVDSMRKAFPLVRVEPDVLYLDEGDILTSAGSAAGIDLCLHIIRKDFGAIAANAVARRAVVPPHREGGQAQFVDKPVGEAAHPWLSKLLHWTQARLQGSITGRARPRGAHEQADALAALHRHDGGEPHAVDHRAATEAGEGPPRNHHPLDRRGCAGIGVRVGRGLQTSLSDGSESEPQRLPQPVPSQDDARAEVARHGQPAGLCARGQFDRRGRSPRTLRNVRHGPTSCA